MDKEWEKELDLIDDPFRRCEICDVQYHEDFGHSCDVCDVWICDNCWPEHQKEIHISK